MADHIVEEIKSRCNIVDVIGRHVVLKKLGSNHKGLCPFHNEKTPSFVVSDTKQIFTCFGCGATGDVIEFVQRYHNLDFHGAIEKLAEEYGIELKDAAFAAEGKKTALYEINRQAAAFFYKCFTTKQNRGLAYMQKRGMDPSTLKKFGIGYADEEWDSLYRYMTSRGVDANTLLELGLVSQSKGKYYDKFRERVVFPIINTRGKVIGFGGRAIGDGTPKYLNSPETPVFYKKNNLYGLNLTRQEIGKEDCAILVEGYMDVISLYKSGVRNVSASLGTALTENQAAMLKRYTKNIILSYDADEAGQNAALRGIDILNKAGLKAKVLHIADGKDPDEFVKKNGKIAFQKLIDQAEPFVEYKINRLKRSYDIHTTEGSVDFLKEAALVLKEVGPIEADVYIRKIAAETKISEGAIRLEVYGNPYSERPMAAEYRRPEASGAKQQSAMRPKEENGTFLEQNLLRLMLLKSEFVRRVRPYERVFGTPACYRIYSVICSQYQEDEELDLQKIEDNLEPEDNSVLGDIMENIQIADKEEQVFQDCVRRIERHNLLKREREIINLLKVKDNEGDSEGTTLLTKELMEIQKKKLQR